MGSTAKSAVVTLKWAVILLGGAGIATALLAQWYRGADHTDRLLASRAVGFEVSERGLSAPAGRVETVFRLTDDRGRQVAGRLSYPDSADGPLPAVLILAGHGTGAQAVDLIDLREPAVLCGLDYPPLPKIEVTPRRVPGLLFELDGLVMDAVGMAFTALDYLAGHPSVDSSRITVLGASFGVPFAVIAGLDERVGGLALIYGGADMERIIEWNLRRRIDSDALRAAAGYVLGTFVAPYEPGEYIGRFSPRPVLLVNGSEDDRIPAESACELYEAAGEPRQRVLVQGGHIHPTNHGLIDNLTAAVSEWMQGRGLL